MRICILPYSRMHYISPFLSVFHPRGIVSNYLTIAIITFYVSSKRLRLKSKGLSDTRAVSIIEKVYYFAVDFV